MSRELLVYLDSSDYSTLSSLNISPENLNIKQRLLEYARNGVGFVYSGPIVSEMAPLQSRSTYDAMRRAEVLEELCGRRTFVALDAIVQAQYMAALNVSHSNVSLVSNDGEWFPKFEESLLPRKPSFSDISDGINGELRAANINRAQRRELIRQKVGHRKKIQPGFERMLREGVETTDYSDIRGLYPMTDSAFDTLRRYVVGTATTKEAEEALVDCLRDPRLVMQWFAAHSDAMSPIISWCRGGAASMFSAVLKSAAITKGARELARAAGTDFSISQEIWNKMASEALVNICNGVMIRLFPNVDGVLTLDRIESHLPGFAVMIRTFYGSAWDALAAKPRNPKESDYLDAVHAFYAPYVGLFRADKYMARHVQSALRTKSCQVVARLSDLPAAIEARLQNPLQEDWS